MVKKKIQKHKYIFLQTLLVATLIFSFGILIGSLVENLRAKNINDLYLESQVDLSDLRIESDILSNLDFNCDSAIKENINFADRIFSEARSLEKYDKSTKISNKLNLAHKRYDILRTLLWYNSIKIKEKCPEKFNTVVYFYDYINPSIEQASKQKAMAKVLIDLKNTEKQNIILIPIAADMNIHSLELLLNSYNITQLPTILINEKHKITEIVNKEKLQAYLES